MSYELYLEHHQRKGARWGIMNGPPYPLSRQKTTGYIEKQKKKVAAMDTPGSSSMKNASAENKNSKSKSDTRKDWKDVQPTVDAYLDGKISKKEYVEYLKENKIYDDLKGTIKKENRASEFIKSALAKHSEKKARKQEEKAEKAAAEHEAEKEKALNSGKASDILKFRGEISNDDMERAIQRINKEQKLEELRKSEVKSPQQTLDAINKNAKNISDYMNTAVNLYNNYNRIKDIYNKEKNKPLEDAKKKLIRSNDVEGILKNQSSLSTDQLKEAMARLTAQKSILNNRDLSTKQRTHKHD